MLKPIIIDLEFVHYFGTMFPCQNLDQDLARSCKILQDLAKMTRSYQEPAKSWQDSKILYKFSRSWQDGKILFNILTRWQDPTQDLPMMQDLDKMKCYTRSWQDCKILLRSYSRPTIQDLDKTARSWHDDITSPRSWLLARWQNLGKILKAGHRGKIFSVAIRWTLKPRPYHVISWFSVC